MGEDLDEIVDNIVSIDRSSKQGKLRNTMRMADTI